MTPGERLIWAAVYATSWVAEAERLRKYNGCELEVDMAARAAEQAWAAVLALREAEFTHDAARRGVVIAVSEMLTSGAA